MKRQTSVLFFCFLVCGAVWGQNVLITQVEWNFLPPADSAGGGPPWLGGSVGTNILLYKTLIQNEILVNFAAITVKDGDREIVVEKPVEGEIPEGEIAEEEIPEEELAEIRIIEGELNRRFLLNVTDNIFVSLNTKVIGLRAGFSGGFGFYSGDLVNFFLNIGGLIGVHILPDSLFSFTIDIKPGYTSAVHWDYKNTDFFSAFAARRRGWTFPFAIGLRMNLDKL
jgi:hypothetical protein